MLFCFEIGLNIKKSKKRLNDDEESIKFLNVASVAVIEMKLQRDVEKLDKELVDNGNQIGKIAQNKQKVRKEMRKGIFNYITVHQIHNLFISLM